MSVVTETTVSVSPVTPLGACFTKHLHGLFNLTGVSLMKSPVGYVECIEFSGTENLSKL